ncbi:MAG TPA: hypothetical protein VE954_21870 [Oligoflexus sp.]|uniref:hypothetical protein n=1 Tax=Oligoflexus sp. TaxID=1971216 RepID=UPI002D245967|nr:hypothetical protein [Oligoflexus sp.]HYX35754.1 hypothetical protein [Oligoflexus sp.]
MNKTTLLFGGFLLSGTTFAGGISGGSGVGAVLTIDENILMSALPKIEIDSDVFRRANARLSTFNEAPVTTPDNDTILVKKKFSRLVDTKETMEIIEKNPSL